MIPLDQTSDFNQLSITTIHQKQPSWGKALTDKLVRAFRGVRVQRSWGPLLRGAPRMALYLTVKVRYEAW